MVLRSMYRRQNRCSPAQRVVSVARLRAEVKTEAAWPHSHAHPACPYPMQSSLCISISDININLGYHHHEK
jgi:hypothetical protein